MQNELIDLRTPMFQRVYKYLKLLEMSDFEAMEWFVYIGTLEGSDQDCISTIIKYVHAVM